MWGLLSFMEFFMARKSLTRRSKGSPRISGVSNKGSLTPNRAKRIPKIGFRVNRELHKRMLHSGVFEALQESGLGSSTTIVHNETYTARNFNTNPLTISGLEGDTYDYEIIFYHTIPTTGHSYISAYLNSDITANYRSYYMQGFSGTVQGGASDVTTVFHTSTRYFAGTAFSKFRITGSSGDERHIDVMGMGDAAGSTVYKKSAYWKNTVDEVQSLHFLDSYNRTADAHIVLYRTPKVSTAGDTQGNWELVESGNVNQDLNSSPYTISNLKGNTYKQYRLILSNLDTSNTTGVLTWQPNGDSSASNYVSQWLRNLSGSITANNFTTFAGVYIEDISTNKTNVEYIINAESGVKRLISESGSTIQGTDDQLEKTTWWSNTVDELTSIKFIKDSSDTVAFDYKLYRRKNPNTIGDTLPFEMVEEVAVSGDFSAGHTFNVTNSDDVLLYKLEWLGANTSGSIDLRLQFNGDTGSNYTRQYLYGTSSTVSAQSATSTQFSFANPENADQSYACTYIYPKSGENRPILNRNIFDENAIRLQAAWWNNTADSINSIKTYALNTDSLTGTLKLSKLTI